MKPFNGYWQRHIPGLRATGRFIRRMRSGFGARLPLSRSGLGISEEILWRRQVARDLGTNRTHGTYRSYKSRQTIPTQSFS